MRHFRPLLLLCICNAVVFNLFAEKFISLKSSDVNMRVGPGREYPVSWVLMRSGLPIMLLSEFGQWRKVQLQDGTQGWIHQSTISYKNTAMVTEDTVLYKSASDRTPIATVQKGVIVICIGYNNGFVKVKSGMKGWIKSDKLWGIRKDDQ